MNMATVNMSLRAGDKVWIQEWLDDPVQTCIVEKLSNWLYKVENGSTHGEGITLFSDVETAWYSLENHLLSEIIRCESEIDNCHNTLATDKSLTDDLRKCYVEKLECFTTLLAKISPRYEKLVSMDDDK